MSSFNNSFSNNPRLIVSEFQSINGALDDVLRTVMGEDEEGTKNGN